jgi:CHAT domain-containing protein
MQIRDFKSIALMGFVMGLMMAVVNGTLATRPAIAQMPQPTVESTDPQKKSADQKLQTGIQQLEAAQYDAAIVTLTQALEQYQKINDRNGIRRSLGNLGIVYESLKNYPKALEFQEQSLALAIALKNRRGEGQSTGNLAIVHYGLGNYPKAIELGERSVAIAREIKNSEDEAFALSNLGRTYYRIKDYQKSIEFHQKSLEIWTTLKDQKNAAIALNSIGMGYEATMGLRAGKEFYAAVDAYQKSLELWRSLKDRRQEATLLSKLGRIYYSINGNDHTMKYYEQALPIFRELKDREQEGIALSYIGRVHQYYDRHPKAIEAQELSLAIAREVKNRQNEGIAANDLAKSLHAVKEFKKAQRLSEFALQIAREFKSQLSEENTLANLGKIYESLGDYQKAIDSQNQRLIIVRELKYSQNEAEAFENLGSTYHLMKDYNRSIEFYQQALSIYLKVNAIDYKPSRVFEKLGNVAQESGNHPQAIEFYQRYFKYHLDRSRPTGGEGNERYRVMSGLGVSLAKVGKLTEAESFLKKAIDEADMFRTARFTDEAASVDNLRVILAERQLANYRILQQILIQQNRIEEALEIAEQGRSRSFVELLAERLGTQVPNLPKPEVENLAKAPKIETIRRIAKEQNATLVEYSIISPEELYIWIIKPNGEIKFHISQLAKTEPIEQIIADSRSSIAVVYPEKTKPKPKSDTDVTLRELHKALIRPIASELPTEPNQRIIFIPQGELFFVPFAAIQDEQGKYLIEKYPISIAPSIQTLQLTREKSKLAITNGNITNGNILVVGDPVMPYFNGVPLEPLSGAKQEAIDIASLFNTQPLLGAQATKSTVLTRMQSASIIHLATHGLLATVKGKTPGAIALTPEGSDNGLLSSSELFDLKLNANLAVLSACDTGRGDIKGDGVIGLSRSLIAAGVPSVVVSLWAVNDESTTVLMSDFYTHLKTNSNKAQAIRQAMLNTMKKYPNPRYWAAFTLIGES